MQWQSGPRKGDWTPRDLGVLRSKPLPQARTCKRASPGRGFSKPGKWALHASLGVHTAAEATTRSTFKIEDPSLGPGSVDFKAPDEGFGLEWTPKPKIQRGPSPKKETLYGYAAVHLGF